MLAVHLSFIPKHVVGQESLFLTNWKSGLWLSSPQRQVSLPNSLYLGMRFCWVYIYAACCAYVCCRRIFEEERDLDRYQCVIFQARNVQEDESQQQFSVADTIAVFERTSSYAIVSITSSGKVHSHCQCFQLAIHNIPNFQYSEFLVIYYNECSLSIP